MAQGGVCVWAINRMAMEYHGSSHRHRERGGERGTLRARGREGYTESEGERGVIIH